MPKPCPGTMVEILTIYKSLITLLMRHSQFQCLVTIPGLILTAVMREPLKVVVNILFKLVWLTDSDRARHIGYM